MTEQQYNDSLAIFHPCGGNRAGKIYDVRDIGTIKSFIKTRASNLGSLQGSISGGFPDYQGQLTAEKMESVNDSSVLAYTGINQNSGNTNLTYSVEVKKGNLRYARLGISYFVHAINKTYYFDLDTLSYVNGDATSSYEELGDGWYRLIVSVDTSGSDGLGQYIFGFSAASSSSSSVTGDFGYIGRVQAIESPTYKLAENNPITDLTVAGGGGTRTNKDGLIEDLRYYNTIYEPDLKNWTKTGVTVSNINDHEYEITEDLGNSVHGIMLYDIMNGIRTCSVEVKKVDASVIFLALILTDSESNGIGSTGIYVDLDTFDNNSIVDIDQRFNGMYDSENNYGNGMTTFTPLSDGWIRITAGGYNSVGGLSNLSIGFLNAKNETGITYTGTGRKLLVRKPQATPGLSIEPYQYAMNVPAFPKIDYSTGQPVFLIEPQSTNRINYYNDFVNGWAGGNYSVEFDPSVLDLEGNDACKVTRIGNSGSITLKAVTDRINHIGGSGVFSLYMRSAGGTSNVRLRIDGDQRVISPSELSTTEWRRFSHPINGGLSDNVTLDILISDTDQPVYVYGGQFELDILTPTSLILTNSSIVTRTDSDLVIPIDFTGDFDIEIDTTIKELRPDSRVLSSKTSNANLLGFRINEDGQLEMWDGSNWINMTSINEILANVRYKLRFVRVSGLITIYKDGVDIGSLSNNIALTTPSIFGRYSTSNYGRTTHAEVFNVIVK